MNIEIVKSYLSILLLLALKLTENGLQAMTLVEKKQMREKVIEMFNHGYQNYMEHAFPDDELMPLSCKGRHRGTTPSRGDIDDLLGNFSLTLIDTLDTLAILGLWSDFEEGVRLVINQVTFDRDIVVSTFETNIRVLGGLLGGHVMAVQAKEKHKAVSWYNDELLEMARELGNRLLPAFNTSTGIPYPRVNLLHGVKAEMSRAGHERDTCTACAGTMILEFAALSRLTGDPIYEEKAHKAMDKLWTSRHRHSNLVGTVINIHNGDWVRRDSGIGAGIDSYYEYLFKAYILLGEDTYLERFNTHYESIMKYINQGPLMVDVHMHKPLTNSRNFMDALLAFWPGLQVLKGDLKPAVELHEMLYQVTQRHNFLPEAFTTDFRVHWGQHPLRPEFLESTYFIYKATGDPHYLDVGKTVMDNLEKHARVPCGFAAIKDVTKGTHEDQMDSYVLAETFKYLYLLYSDKEDIFVDMDNFIFTTEAHLLPLSLSMQDRINITKNPPRVTKEDDDYEFERSCPNNNHLHRNNVNYAADLRSPLKNLVDNLCPKPRGVQRKSNRLRAADFVAGNKEQLVQLNKMGIKIITMSDGRVQLLHTASEASSSDDAEDGMQFMQEMIEFSKAQQTEAVQQDPMMLQLLSPPHYGNVVFNAGPAQFGPDLKKMEGIQGEVVIGESIKGCKLLLNEADIKGKIVIVERGECMFVDKARILEAAGAIAGIVLDNNEGSTSENSPLFAMSGDGKDDVNIPLVFLFNKQGTQLAEALAENPQLVVFVGSKARSSDLVLKGIIAEEQNKYDKITKSQKNEQKELSDITFKTPDGLPIFHISRDQDNKIQIKMEKSTMEQRMKQRMGQALEQIIALLQEKLNLGKLGISKQSHYLYDLGKLMEASMNERTTDEQFQKVIQDVLERNDLSDLADDKKSTLDKNMDAILNTYIETQISKVVGEAKDYVDKVSANAAPEDGAQSYLNIESSVNTADANDQGVNSDTQRHYATDEELVDRDVRVSVKHKIDLSSGNIIQKAPSWMGLKPGEVLVARDGSMYAVSGYDEEGLAEELERDGFQVQEMYLVEEGSDKKDESLFDFEAESETSDGEKFVINYAQARDRLLKSNDQVTENIDTDENNNVIEENGEDSVLEQGTDEGEEKDEL